MEHKMKFLFFLLAAFVISSCSEFEDDEITYTIPVDSISVKNISKLKAEFMASNFCGSMCWEKTYFEKIIIGNDVFIKTFAVADGSTACPAVCVYTETQVSIMPLSVGSYTFHFWKSNTSSIDTTLIIGL
jgi:hypothetical protein